MRAAVLSFMAILVFILFSSPEAHAVDPTQMPTPELQQRYKGLTHELRCMQCQNQAIADSPVGLASDLRREVHDLLMAGKTDNEIREFMVDRYGQFILFRPEFSAKNAWLWLLPVVLLLLGAGVAIRIVRQRTRLVSQDTQDTTDGDANAR